VGHAILPDGTHVRTCKQCHETITDRRDRQ
jgi:hypothetical protein